MFRYNEIAMISSESKMFLYFRYCIKYNNKEQREIQENICWISEWNVLLISYPLKNFKMKPKYKRHIFFVNIFGITNIIFYIYIF